MADVNADTRIAEIAPECGYWHVATSNLHARSTRDADPPYPSFDVVLRGDFDALASESARVQAELATANLGAERQVTRAAIAEDALAAARQRERKLRDALMMCEDALVDDALDWHEAHVARGEDDAEDCAVCVVANALAVVPLEEPAREPVSLLTAEICRTAERMANPE